MNTGINDSKTLKRAYKHISYELKCKFDSRKCYADQNWNNFKCRCECEIHNVYEKDYIWNPSTCTC